MLSYLLGLIQEFERSHGRVPVLVSLNTRHMQYLLQECPDLVRDDEAFSIWISHQRCSGRRVGASGGERVARDACGRRAITLPAE